MVSKSMPKSPLAPKVGKATKFRSEYYPHMKVALFALLVLIIIVSGVLVYGAVDFYGIDFTGQITGAATP